MTNDLVPDEEVLKAFLLEARFTQDLREDEIDILVEIAEPRKYTQGTTIILEDSKSRDLYIILGGRASVRISLPSELEREEIVYSMREGQIFGELSLVDGSPRSATIWAEEDVLTYKFEFGRLSKVLENHPRIGYILMRNIASIIADRMRNTNMLWRNSLIW